MQFNLYANFRLLARTKSVQIDLPDGITARAAINLLLERVPELRACWLDESGEISTGVHFLVGGHPLNHMNDGLNNVLKPDDVMDCFSAIGGG